MALSNAEKQARHRARQKAKLAELDELKGATLSGALPALDALIAADHAKRQKASRKPGSASSRAQVLADLLTGENKTGLAGEAIAAIVSLLPLETHEQAALKAAVAQREFNRKEAAAKRKVAKERKEVADQARMESHPDYGRF